MKRFVSAAIVALFVAASSGALADDYKWDPKNMHKQHHAAGDKFVTEGTTEQQNEMTMDEKPMGPMNVHTVATYKIDHEVIAVSDKGKVTEEVLTVEEFSLKDLQKKDAAEDTSLKGKHIRVKDDDAKVEDDKDKSVTPAAHAWVRSELVKGGKKEKEQEKAMDAAAFPKEPIAPDTEWDGDPKVLAEALIKGAEIDPAKSKVHGKLSQVTEEGGKHKGHLDVVMEIQLKSMPGPGGKMPFKEGGLMHISVARNAALDEEDGPGTHEMHMDFSCKAEVPGQGGKKQLLALDQHMSKKETVTPGK